MCMRPYFVECACLDSAYPHRDSTRTAGARWTHPRPHLRRLRLTRAYLPRRPAALRCIAVCQFRRRDSRRAFRAQDGWVLSWFKAYAGEADDGLFEAALARLRAHRAWTADALSGGEYLADLCLFADPAFSALVASSWAPLAETQSVLAPCVHCASVLKYFEARYGAVELLPDGTRAFYYNVSKSMRSQVTANLAMSMAVDSQTWRALYGSGAAEALRRDKPHISRADWPRVMVRVAHFDQPTRTLRFTLTPGGAAVAASIVERRARVSTRRACDARQRDV
jgi:hypothetical protein